MSTTDVLIAIVTVLLLLALGYAQDSLMHRSLTAWSESQVEVSLHQRTVM